MPAKSNRPQKVGDMLHRVIAEALLREVKDPRLNGVTVTSVEASGDLSIGKVYFSVLDGVDVKEVVAGFDKCNGFLRRLIAQQCQLRIVPVLTFHYDDTTIRAQAIDALIAKALKKK